MVKELENNALPERVRCSKCDKPVSTPVPRETIARAWVECLERVERRVAKWPMTKRKTHVCIPPR